VNALHEAFLIISSRDKVWLWSYGLALHMIQLQQWQLHLGQLVQKVIGVWPRMST